MVDSVDLFYNTNSQNIGNTISNDINGNQSLFVYVAEWRFTMNMVYC